MKAFKSIRRLLHRLLDLSTPVPTSIPKEVKPEPSHPAPFSTVPPEGADPSLRPPDPVIYQQQRREAGPRFVAIATQTVHNCLITCCGKTDGIGAQAQAIFSTILLARGMNIPYVHTPLSNVAHKPDSATHWEQDWETFFGFENISGIIRRHDLSRMDLTEISIANASEFKKTDNTLFKIEHCHDYADLFPEQYEDIIPDLIAASARRKQQRSTHRTLNKINIAIHIRRGDVQQQRNSLRFTPNDTINQTLQSLRKALGRLNLPSVARIYSQGTPADFEAIQDIDEFHLNEDMFETMHNLIEADVLIMSKSSMSYVAALLNSGIVVYESCWHMPLPGWLHHTMTSDQLAPILKTKLQNHPSA